MEGARPLSSGRLRRAVTMAATVMLVGTEDGYVVGSCRSWSGDGSVGVLVEALTQPPGGSS